MPKLAALVMDFVAARGVRHVFLVTGGGAMHLNDALGRASIAEAYKEQVKQVRYERVGAAKMAAAATLVEEGHSTPHLIHIWQLLVRHADLYYSSR